MVEPKTMGDCGHSSRPGMARLCGSAVIGVRHRAGRGTGHPGRKGSAGTGESARERLPSVHAPPAPSGEAMRNVLIVAPTRRDLLNLVDGRVLARYDLRFEEGPGISGVFGSSDSTAALATVVADRLGLPGPGYEAFMRCHDKLVCRRIQAEAVAEVTTAFATLDALRPPDEPPLPYPFFVKPVRGHLSQSAYEVDGPDRLGQV